MKFNQIALAILATAVATVASAGVTVTPLAGYNYVHKSQAEKQRGTYTVGYQFTNADGTQSNVLNGGVSLKNDLYTGVAVGLEITPATQLQVEYGTVETVARASKSKEGVASNPKFSAKQQNLSGNVLVGFDQFVDIDSNFKPYILVGGGQQATSIKNDTQYTHNDYSKTPAVQTQYTEGTEVVSAKSTIGNVGLGARYLVNDGLAIRGEGRAVHNFENKWWEAQALAGLEVTLGGRLKPVAPVIPQPEPEVKPTPVVEVKPVEPEVKPVPVEVKPVPVEVKPQPKPKPQPVVPEIVDDMPVDNDRDGVVDHLDRCLGTPYGTPVNAQGCPQEVRRPLRQNLPVFFDYDKAIIKPQYREVIADFAATMRELPNSTAIIEGHASKDSKRSNARYNQRLSEARANAVKAVLSNEFGIAPHRISAIGYGFDRPYVPNDTAENKALNRRVVGEIRDTSQR